MHYTESVISHKEDTPKKTRGTLPGYSEMLQYNREEKLEMFNSKGKKQSKKQKLKIFLPNTVFRHVSMP